MDFNSTIHFIELCPLRSDLNIQKYQIKNMVNYPC